MSNTNLPVAPEAMIHKKDFIDAEYISLEPDSDSILHRKDIAALVLNLAIDPRPVGEPVAQLRATQAHLVKALSGLKSGTDFNTLSQYPSQHIQDVLKTLANQKPDVVTQEIHDALRAIEAEKNGAQQGGKPRILPSVGDLLKKKSKPNFGAASLYAEEVIQRDALFRRMRHAVESGDPKAEKEAVRQARNLKNVHAKMMKENSEGMHKRLKQSKEELDKWLENLNGLSALKDAISGLVQAIGNFFRRMSPKGN